jgi:hypothetical protein
MVQPDRPQMTTIWRMRIAFPQQQWLRERHAESMRCSSLVFVCCIGSELCDVLINSAEEFCGLPSLIVYDLETSRRSGPFAQSRHTHYSCVRPDVTLFCH